MIYSLRAVKTLDILINNTNFNYIKVDIQEMGWGGVVDWIELAQDKDKWRDAVNTAMKLRFRQCRTRD